MSTAPDPYAALPKLTLRGRFTYAGRPGSFGPFSFDTTEPVEG